MAALRRSESDLETYSRFRLTGSGGHSTWYPGGTSNHEWSGPPTYKIRDGKRELT